MSSVTLRKGSSRLYLQVQHNPLTTLGVTSLGSQGVVWVATIKLVSPPPRGREDSQKEDDDQYRHEDLFCSHATSPSRRWFLLDYLQPWAITIMAETTKIIPMRNDSTYTILPHPSYGTSIPY